MMTNDVEAANTETVLETAPSPMQGGTQKSTIAKLFALAIAAAALGTTGTVLGAIALAIPQSNEPLSDAPQVVTDTAVEPATLQGSKTLYDVASRGSLRCGIPDNRAGFGIKDENGEYVGMDVDLVCAFRAGCVVQMRG